MELAGGASHFTLLAAVAAPDGVSATSTPSETRVRGIDLAGDAGTWSSTLASAETHWASTYSYGELAADRQEVTNLRLPGQYDERLFQQAGINMQGPYYNWYRWYLPSSGRYLELDPITLAGGFNIRYTLDWYNYANGNSLSHADPRGLWPLEGCPGCMDTCCCSEMKNPGSCPGAGPPITVEPGQPPPTPEPPPTTPNIPPGPPPPDVPPLKPGVGCKGMFDVCMTGCLGKCGNWFTKGACAAGCTALYLSCLAQGV